MPLDLAFTETGNGQAVLIAHGLFGWKRNWAGIAKPLGETHRVFTIDMRNHGESPHAPEMSYHDMAADMARFIEQNGLAPLPVIGHSMGGKASMVLALTRPELVERLLVLDIAPIDYAHDYNDYIAAMQRIDLSQVTRRSDIEPLIAAVAEDRSVQAFLMQNLASAETGGYRWRVNLDAIDRHMADIMSFPQFDTGLAYNGTALFLGGGDSDRLTPHAQTEIDRLFPAAEIDFIADAGHWVHADQPEAVLKRFQTFLA